MENKFDLNAWLRHLRRKYPLFWAVASTLGHIVRGFVRVYVPLLLCFVIFENILEPIFAQDSRMIPHWLPLVAALPTMAVMIWQDRRLEYEVMRARRGEDMPSLWHDAGVVFGSIIYWVTVVITAIMLAGKATYLAPVVAAWMPGATKAAIMLYASVLPAAAMIVLETLFFFIVLRIWYYTIPVEDEPIEPSFPSLFHMFIQALVWGTVLLLLPVGGWVIVTTGMVVVLFVGNYWRQLIVIVPCVVAAVLLLRVWRVWRIRSRCVKKLRREMEESRIHYEFEAHPIRSAFFGGEDVSLRVFIGDTVKLVRFVPFYSRRGTLIVTPDGNVGQLHRISMGRPVRYTRLHAPDAAYAEYDPSGNGKKNSMTEWITKRDTVFEDANYPDAEKIYLISPTPKFWVAGDLKATANLDNGSRAYGYTLWTTTAFCRYLRMRQEDVLRGR